jgi:regulator of sirC expression with transglutaminase-like and TPR domain
MRKTKMTLEQLLEALLRYAAGEREFSRFAGSYRVHRSATTNAVLD